MSVSEGHRFVMYAAEICESLGMHVFVPPRENNKPWDMLANGNKVQVKKRGVCTSKPNNVRLVTANGSNASVYSVNDFVAVAIHWRNNWYVIPSRILSRPDGSLRNGIYMPHVAEWVNRWSILATNHEAALMQRQFDF
jgi:hypothetical protein